MRNYIDLLTTAVSTASTEDVLQDGLLKAFDPVSGLSQYDRSNESLNVDH